MGNSKTLQSNNMFYNQTLLGSNIGTSITSTLVSLGQLVRIFQNKIISYIITLF